MLNSWCCATDYGTFEATSDAFSSRKQGSKNRKWLMLAILSVLSGVNQGVCYSYAPIATMSETRWEQHVSPIRTLFG